MSLFHKRVQYTDDLRGSVFQLFLHRLPWLLVGLIGGVFASYVVSEYEKVLEGTLELAFFIPIIVYMSDAVGTQTETIYVRNLSREKMNFLSLFFRELGIGLCLGSFFGLFSWIFAYIWLHSFEIALVVGLAMFINISLAPMISIIVPQLLAREHKDPALGSGPFTTIVLDVMSLLIYFVVASAILL